MKKIRGSEWIAMASLAFGAVIAGGAYWLFPSAYWWVYLIIGAVAAGSAYDQWLKMVANEKIIDRGDWPNKQ